MRTVFTEQYSAVAEALAVLGRRQMRPTSRASAASSCGPNRVRGRVTAAWVRPRSSSVTAHSSGGLPREVKNAATRSER